MSKTFVPPNQDQSMPDYFWGRYSIPVGISVVRAGESFVNLPTPTHDELEAAGDEGADFFRGGYTYRGLPDAVAAALEAAGYVIHLSGYGEGAYGDGHYGGLPA